jgi:hypothetical protein
VLVMEVGLQEIAAFAPLVRSNVLEEGERMKWKMDWIVKQVEPVVVLKDPAENSLIVAK